MGVVEVEGREEIVAVGRYAVGPETNMAETALLVRDDWQGRGIGTWLQKYLIEIVKSRGIIGFTSRVLEENTGALHMAHKSGLTVESTLEEGGVYVISYKFLTGRSLAQNYLSRRRVSAGELEHD